MGVRAWHVVYSMQLGHADVGGISLGGNRTRSPERRERSSTSGSGTEDVRRWDEYVVGE